MTSDRKGFGGISAVVAARGMRALATFIMAFAVLFAPSFVKCANGQDGTTDSSKFPAPSLEIPIGNGTLPGDPLVTTLTTGWGQKLLFIVDTGAARTFLDKSLEPQLGLRRGTGDSIAAFGYQPSDEGVFKAPRLYLSGMQIATGSEISTMELHGTPKLPIMGVLGMDCLSHYCIQLDLASRKMHFVSRSPTNTDDFGSALPMVVGAGGLKPWIEVSFFDKAAVPFLLDTGFANGGDLMLTPKLFERAFQGQSLTNYSVLKTTTGQLIRVASCPIIQLGGETYKNAVLWEIPLKPGEADSGIIGLRFLARHRVVFDFPNQTLYLKRISGDSSLNTSVEEPSSK